MDKAARTVVLPYVVAVFATAVAVGVRWLLNPWLNEALPFVTLFGAVAVAVWIGGYRPALLAAFLGWLVCEYWFIAPRGGFRFDDFRLLVGLIAYLVSCALIIGFGETLRVSRRRAKEQQQVLRITLASIGDAVIATDAEGNMTFLNPVAEQLTGWKSGDARGKPLDAVFRIINEETRKPVENPVRTVLKRGQVVGLANHTVLIRKDGTERPIDDSAAPIRDDDDTVIGVVLVFHDIGERRAVERRLERSERELADFFESAAVGLHWVGPDGAILRANQTELRMLGYPSDEYVGRNIAEFHADKRLIGEIMQRLAAGESIVDQDAQMLCKDGSTRTVLINSNVRWEDGKFVHTRCFTQDITAQRAAEAASRQLAAIVESSDDAIVSKDLEGIVINWNRAAERVFGYRAEEMVGQPVAILIPPDQPDEEPAILECIRRGDKVVPYETVRRRKDGTLVPISLTVSPVFDANGRVIGASKIARDISDRRQQQAALRRAGDQLREITDALPVLISLVDTHAHYRLNNRTYEEWFQRSRSEVTGRHMRDVLGDTAWAVIGPKIEAALAGQTVRYEAEVNYAGAGRRWISATYTPQFDGDGKVVGAAVLVLDITDRKRAEQALRRWERVFQHAGWPVALVDAPTNHLTTVNPAYAAMHGYTVEEMIGKPLGDVFAPESLAELDSHVKAVHEKGDHVYESVHMRKDGTVFPCLTHVTAFKDEAGNVEYRAATLQDLSAIKAAEKELREADRRKDEFVATLAHELRNPLAPIRNAVQVLKSKSELDPHQMWGRDVIDRQARIMARLLEDLLDVSRISRNKMDLRKQRVTLAAVLETAVETSRPLIDERKHDLAVDLTPEVIYLDADPVRLAQVFSNLLNNAAKFTEAGGTIRVTAQRHGNQVLISVKDPGVGIDPEMLPRLFELFSQAHALDESRGGLGIGLALARGIVVLHGGTIEARSEGPGQGAEVIVRLPIAVEPWVEAFVAHKTEDAATPAARHRVLVVDDHRDSAESLAMMLQFMGYEVDLAFDGEEAIAAAQKLLPDVMLLDIGMPKLNGHEACRRIRDQPWGRRIHIIAMTGWGQQEDRRRTQEAGFDHHLVKPVDPAELERMLALLSAGPGSANAGDRGTDAAA